MRLRIKLVIGITVFFIFLGLLYITIDMNIRYYKESKNLVYINDKFSIHKIYSRII